MIDIITNDRIAKNLLKIIWYLVMGLVVKVSIVPLLYSSDNARILIAGIRSKNNNGAREKKASIDAYALFKMLMVLISDHRSSPFISKNSPIVNGPIILLKNTLISFLYKSII